jgi:hypothetical protein
MAATLPEIPETPERQNISYEDLLAHDPGEHAEWVNGEAVALSTPSTAHQLLSAWTG